MKIKVRVSLLTLYLLLFTSLLLYGMPLSPDKPTLANNVVLIKVKSADGRIGRGTGLIVTEDFYIITAYHVVQGSSEILIYTQFSSGDSLRARIVESIPEEDIVLLKVSTSKKIPNFKPVKFLCPIDDKLIGRDVLILANLVMTTNFIGIITGVFPESVLMCVNTTLVTGVSGSPVIFLFLDEEIVIGLMQYGLIVKRVPHPIYGEIRIVRSRFGIIPACNIVSLLKKHNSVHFESVELPGVTCGCHKHSEQAIK